MGDVINLDEYRNSREIEEIYQEFVTYTNKFIGLPTDIIRATVILYCILRYMEGTINALNLLRDLDPNTDLSKLDEIKEIAIPWLESILESLKSDVK